MSYTIQITEDAEHDLEDIYDYIYQYDCLENANYVLQELLSIAGNLTGFPERGSVVKELKELGFIEFRQVFFKPYRLIYRILEKRVIIYLVVDGRRDLQSVLSKRLLNK